MKYLTPGQLWTCVKVGAVKTIMHDGIEHAGYLAFLGLLALFPFLVFIVAVVGVIGQGQVGTDIISSLFQHLPAHVNQALKPRVEEIVSGPPQGLLTVSILGAVWTASSAVEGIRTVLNRAYHVEAPPAYWFRRSLSVLQLLIFAFITIIAMVLLVSLQLLIHHLEDVMNIRITDDARYFLSKSLYLISVGILFIAVSSIYYTVPNIKQQFISVAPGAIAVVLGWLGFAYLFTLYLLNFNQVNLIYGGLGGIIAALLFFYVCNIIFIFGAEFNYQLVQALGQRVIPSKEARETPQDD